MGMTVSERSLEDLQDGTSFDPSVSRPIYDAEEHVAALIEQLAERDARIAELQAANALFRDYETVYERDLAAARERIDHWKAEFESVYPRMLQAQQERDAARAEARALREALEDISAYDCETEGCSADNPMCVGGTAKAALSAVASTEPPPDARDAVHSESMCPVCHPGTEAYCSCSCHLDDELTSWHGGDRRLMMPPKPSDARGSEGG